MDKITLFLEEHQVLAIIRSLSDKVHEQTSEIKSLKKTVDDLDQRLYVRDICREEYENEQFLKFLDSEQPEGD